MSDVLLIIIGLVKNNPIFTSLIGVWLIFTLCLIYLGAKYVNTDKKTTQPQTVIQNNGTTIIGSQGKIGGVTNQNINFGRLQRHCTGHNAQEFARVCKENEGKGLPIWFMVQASDNECFTYAVEAEEYLKSLGYKVMGHNFLSANPPPPAGVSYDVYTNALVFTIMPTANP